MKCYTFFDGRVFDSIEINTDCNDCQKVPLRLGCNDGGGFMSLVCMNKFNPPEVKKGKIHAAFPVYVNPKQGGDPFYTLAKPNTECPSRVLLLVKTLGLGEPKHRQWGTWDYSRGSITVISSGKTCLVGGGYYDALLVMNNYDEIMVKIQNRDEICLVKFVNRDKNQFDVRKIKLGKEVTVDDTEYVF